MFLVIVSIVEENDRFYYIVINRFPLHAFQVLYYIHHYFDYLAITLIVNID